MKTIVLNGDIDSDSADLFCWEIEQASASGGIEIRIDSPGGRVTAMNRMLDAMRKFTGKITTTATGTVASAATCIFLLGHRRRVVEDAVLMIHNARTASSGKETAGTREISSQIAQLISLRTGVPQHQIAEWMQGEQYFDSAFSLRWRLAHSLAPSSLTTSMPDVSRCTQPVVSDRMRESAAYRLAELDFRHKQIMRPKRKPTQAAASDPLSQRVRELQRRMNEIDSLRRRLRAGARPSTQRVPTTRQSRQPIVVPPMPESIRRGLSRPFGFAPGYGQH